MRRRSVLLASALACRRWRAPHPPRRRSRPAARAPISPTGAGGRAARRAAAHREPLRRARRRGSSASPARARAAPSSVARPGSLVRVYGRGLQQRRRGHLPRRRGRRRRRLGRPARAGRDARCVARVPRTAVERPARARAGGRHALAGDPPAAGRRAGPAPPARRRDRRRGAGPQGLLRRRSDPPSSPTSSAGRARDRAGRARARPRTAPWSRSGRRGVVAPGVPQSVALGRHGATARSQQRRRLPVPRHGDRRVGRARDVRQASRARRGEAPEAFTFLGYRFPVAGAHGFGEFAAGVRRRPRAPGPGRLRRVRHAARRGPRRGRGVQAVPLARRLLPRDRRRQHRRRLRLHAPARGGAGGRRATRSRRAS